MEEVEDVDEKKKEEEKKEEDVNGEIVMSSGNTLRNTY